MKIIIQPWRKFINRELRLIVCAAATTVLLLPSATAQQPSPQSNADDASLKNDVQQLKIQQQLILDRLDELKKILSARRTDNPQPPAIKVPDTMGVDGELFRGDPNAAVAIIEYGDIECPFCRRFKQDIYPKIDNDYIKTGKARFYYRDMPLAFHEHAMPAAKAEHCAGEQGEFWQMHDSLFTDKPGSIGPGGRKSVLDQKDIDERAGALGLDTSKLDACMGSTRYADVIKRNSDDAAKMNIEGTPTFLIGTVGPGGKIVNLKKPLIGAQPFEVFKTAIDPLLTPADQHALNSEPAAAKSSEPTIQAQVKPLGQHPSQK